MADSLCSQCNGLCCRYVALPLDTPTTKAEYDNIRWYLAHEGISVFVDKGDWYVNFAARCKFLNRDNRCDIYETRPKICRKYNETNCDYHSGDYGYDLHFTSIEELDEYLDKINMLPETAKGGKNTKKK